ncbi:MAG: 16S rRNA (guanine(527)-N(7))-methyltransferase RsmG [Bacteroidales bacterium]|nr:16S rRNA (guanine(527)-N(7))-methyltransferase RsmG [Bacteroidales bacterium]
MELIKRYFPDFTEEQIERFAALPALYEDWNSKINVISRKDIEHFETRHMLHSLAVAKYVMLASKDSKGFPSGATVVDVGCGGGFPSIPLAIAFPDVQFTAMDSIGKKIKVVEGVASALGLTNVEPIQARSTDIHDRKWDYMVSRAVTAFPDFVKQTKHLIKGHSATDEIDFVLPHGTFYLKGGDFKAEINPFGARAKVQSISEWFEDEFFETKSVIYLKQ